MTSAFMLRRGENHLAVNWLEHFDPDDPQQTVSQLGHELKRNRIRRRANSRHAVLNVGSVKMAAKRTTGRSLHVVRLPRTENATHAGIFGYTEDDLMVAAEIRAMLRANTVLPV